MGCYCCRGPAPADQAPHHHTQLAQSCWQRLLAALCLLHCLHALPAAGSGSYLSPCQPLLYFCRHPCVLRCTSPLQCDLSDEDIKWYRILRVCIAVLLTCIAAAAAAVLLPRPPPPALLHHATCCSPPCGRAALPPQTIRISCVCLLFRPCSGSSGTPSAAFWTRCSSTQRPWEVHEGRRGWARVGVGVARRTGHSFDRPQDPGRRVDGKRGRVGCAGSATAAAAVGGGGVLEGQGSP